MKYFNIFYLSSALTGLLALVAQVRGENCIEECEFCSYPRYYDTFNHERNVKQLFDKPITFNGVDMVCMPWFINNCFDVGFWNLDKQPAPYVVMTKLYHEDWKSNIHNFSVIYKTVPGFTVAAPTLFDYTPDTIITADKRIVMTAKDARRMVYGSYFADPKNTTLTHENIRRTGECMSSKVCVQHALHMLAQRGICVRKQVLDCHYYPRIPINVNFTSKSYGGSYYRGSYSLNELFNITDSNDNSSDTTARDLLQLTQENPNCQYRNLTNDMLSKYPSSAYYIGMVPTAVHEYPVLPKATSNGHKYLNVPNTPVSLLCDPYVACSVDISKSIMERLLTSCSNVSTTTIYNTSSNIVNVILGSFISLIMGIIVGVIGLKCYICQTQRSNSQPRRHIFKFGKSAISNPVIRSHSFTPYKADPSQAHIQDISSSDQPATLTLTSSSTTQPKTFAISDKPNISGSVSRQETRIEEPKIETTYIIHKASVSNP